MDCSTAKLLLLDHPGDSRVESCGEALAAHLADCRECRETLSQAEVVGAILRQWPDQRAPEADHRAAVNAMANAFTPSQSRSWLRRLVPRPLLGLRAVPIAAAIAICALFVVFWPNTVESDPVAAVSEALEGVDTWSANGTITPALIGLDGVPTNKIEIWFRKPDTMRVCVDGDLLQMLQEGGTRTWYLGPMERAIIEDTEEIDLVRLFSVGEWLKDEAVLAAPVKDLGVEWFLPQRVRVVDVDVRAAHPQAAEGLGLERLIVRANVDSMLPVHIEAEGFSALRDRMAALMALIEPADGPSSNRIRNTAVDHLTLHLHFRYSATADPDAFALDIHEGTPIQDRRSG